MNNAESQIESESCGKTDPDDFEWLLQTHTIMKSQPQKSSAHEDDELNVSQGGIVSPSLEVDEFENDDSSSSDDDLSENVDIKDSALNSSEAEGFCNRTQSIADSCIMDEDKEEEEEEMEEDDEDEDDEDEEEEQEISECKQISSDDVKEETKLVTESEDSRMSLKLNLNNEKLTPANSARSVNTNSMNKSDARSTSKRNTKIIKKNYCELQSSDEENFGEYENETIAEMRAGTTLRRNLGPVWTKEEEIVMTELKRSKKTFLQNVPCTKLTSSVTKCRECRRRDASKGSTGSIFCRFFEFRRLQFDDTGRLRVSGFSNPYLDPKPEDLNIWFPDKNTPNTTNLDLNICRFILLHVGDQFCYLWRQESEALLLHMSENKTIAWKKIVRGVREICDVCDTTLFNYHWTCNKCGFGVCIDCYKDRKNSRTIRRSRNASKERRDDHYWLMCTFRESHNIADLMLTQIIAGDSLNELGKLMHQVRALFHIPQSCDCMLAKDSVNVPSNDLNEILYEMIVDTHRHQTSEKIEMDKFCNEIKKRGAEGVEMMEKFKRFEEALEMGAAKHHQPQNQFERDPISYAFEEYKDLTFLRKGLAGPRRFLPPKIMTYSESETIAPGLPHQWLCDGKLLRLKDGMHPNNRELFQQVWKSGQPVMVSNVSKYLNIDLWRPEAFCKDFGEKENDLVNCLNGNLVPSQPMKHFWEGFQCIQKRLLDSNGSPMLLKLKDWPPGDDFAEILPTRFSDLMRGLPMPEYTLRTGVLNIASCLPNIFVRPDLGPKMYNAYGSALHPDKGTTNLHLDISDAVNIMVYVGIPKDSDANEQIEAVCRSIDRGGCDYFTRKRVRQPNILPGALWHIFSARDADKIRDLLNRVTIEKGYRLEADHDPIHDQNWYLDEKLRGRLYDEYGVEGYPIVQCLGDAVFIPAGAPHQVQNLHNCIKVAEDFVSPENITHCYHLTHEFRRLSYSHSNHEDKLQIKNIIYHATKDCAITLLRLLDAKIRELSEIENINQGAENEEENNPEDILTKKSKHGKNSEFKEESEQEDDDDDEKDEYEFDINKCKEIIEAEYEAKLAEAALDNAKISQLPKSTADSSLEWDSQKIKASENRIDKDQIPKTKELQGQWNLSNLSIQEKKTLSIERHSPPTSSSKNLQNINVGGGVSQITLDSADAHSWQTGGSFDIMINGKMFTISREGAKAVE